MAEVDWVFIVRIAKFLFQLRQRAPSQSHVKCSIWSGRHVTGSIFEISKKNETQENSSPERSACLDEEKTIEKLVVSIGAERGNAELGLSINRLGFSKLRKCERPVPIFTKVRFSSITNLKIKKNPEPEL